MAHAKQPSPSYQAPDESGVFAIASALESVAGHGADDETERELALEILGRFVDDFAAVAPRLSREPGRYLVQMFASPEIRFVLDAARTLRDDPRLLEEARHVLDRRKTSSDGATDLVSSVENRLPPELRGRMEEARFAVGRCARRIARLASTRPSDLREDRRCARDYGHYNDQYFLGIVLTIHGLNVAGGSQPLLEAAVGLAHEAAVGMHGAVARAIELRGSSVPSEESATREQILAAQAFADEDIDDE